jgi:hypothetical protein
LIPPLALLIASKQWVVGKQLKHAVVLKLPVKAVVVLQAA